MKHSLQLKLSQHLTLTPQLQQSIRLLQLSTVELNQELERYLAENPLLERIDLAGEDTPVAAGAAASATASEAEAEALAAANKRIRNIVRKADVAIPDAPNPALYEFDAERDLHADHPGQGEDDVAQPSNILQVERVTGRQGPKDPAQPMNDKQKSQQIADGKDQHIGDQLARQGRVDRA